MKLREITGEYLEFLQMAEDTDIDPEVFVGTMEAIDGELEVKADAYADIIAVLTGDADILQREIDRLKYRKTVLENRGAALKKNLESCMLAMEKKKIKTDLHTFGIRKNPPSLHIIDENKIPDKYWKPQEPKLDSAALKADVKANPDAFQEYVELHQGESLIIR